VKLTKAVSALFVVSLLLFIVIPVLAQDRQATIVTSTLNFRDEPSLSGQILDKLHYGDAYPVLARTVSGHWYQLNVDGTLGWVCGQFVDIGFNSLELPANEDVVNEDCRGNTVPLWPTSNPFTLERVNGHIKVTENLTGRSFTSFAQYSTPNNAKDWGFNADKTKFAVAYHYGHNGGYTWRGVWSTANDYTFGYFLYWDIVPGKWTGIQGVFD